MTTSSTTVDSKIISFPAHKIVRPPVVNSALIEQVQLKGAVSLADSITSEILHATLADMEGAGLNTETKKFIEDFNFLSLCVAATVYRALDLEHPFQEAIDSVKIVEVSDKTPEEPNQ